MSERSTAPSNRVAGIPRLAPSVNGCEQAETVPNTNNERDLMRLVINRARETTAPQVSTDAFSEGNSQQEFSLVLVARKAAIGVEKVLRSPPRVADLRLQVNDEGVHVETGAEHEPAGGIVADEGVCDSGGHRHYRRHRVLQAGQSIPGHTSIHI